MPTAVFARGIRGDLIETLQRGLSKIYVPRPGNQGEEPALNGPIDGDFGASTQTAVRRVQRKKELPVTGIVNEALWVDVTEVPWPGSWERSLGLLASFEGHGYTKAAGNYDGAGITWGIIGFTLIHQKKVKDKVTYSYGPLRDLLKTAFADHEEAVIAAFGKERAELLGKKLDAAPGDLHKFAVEISDPGKKKNYLKLVDVWQKAFTALGADPGIRELQRSAAKASYYDPAMDAADAFADEFDMPGERTQQLFLDIQVNNGGLGTIETNSAKKKLSELISGNPDATLSEKLHVITEVLAKSRKKFAKDIRERKGTISEGFGTVHGKDYRLEGWGIELEADEAPPTPMLPMTILGVDPFQQDEQFTLASAARQCLGLVEEGAELARRNRWPLERGIDLIESDNVGTLSMRGLLGPPGSKYVRPAGEALLHAVNLMFRAPVGLLAVMGQTTARSGVSADWLVIGRGTRCYVGISLTPDDELKLIRERTRGASREASMLDITEVRPLLRECRMLMLFSGYGITGPMGVGAGSGERWRNWLAPVGAAPIVLGWFGNVKVPQDAAQRFVSSDFMRRLSELSKDLRKLYQDHPDAVVQCWGQACHAAFSMTRQKYLWSHQPLPWLEITHSGAAAIGRDGKVWHANPAYVGNPEIDAMEQVA